MMQSDPKGHQERWGGRPVGTLHAIRTTALSTLHPVANWYRLLVSNAWQADQILQELQSVRVTVGASLRARQHFKAYYEDIDE